MRRQSLKFKLTILIVSGILSTGVILGLILSWGYFRDAQRRLSNTISKELEIVSYATNAGLEFNDTRTVDDAVALLKNVREFVNVSVFDSHGKIFVVKRFHEDINCPEADFFTVRVPVLSDSKDRIGEIEAVATRVYFKNEIKRTLGIIVAVVLLVTLAALLLAIFFLNRFFLPLLKLKEAIDGISQQGFIGQVEVLSNDEVGDLATSFNTMSGSLKATTVSRDELVKEMEQRKQIEEALRKSEAKYRVLIETTNTGYLILDNHGKVLDANAEYIRLSGHENLGEIRGRSVIEWTAEADRARNAEAVRECIQQGFVRNFEIDYVDRNGQRIPIEIQATIIKAGESFQIVSLCRDITQRKRAAEELKQAYEQLKLAQSRLVQSEKMASLGVLAAGVAHEINNPLGFIISNFEVLRIYFNSYNKIVAAVEVLIKEISVDAAERVLKLIEEFRSLQQNENMEVIVKDIDPLLDQTRGGLDRVKKIVLDLKTFAHSDTTSLVKTDLNKLLDNAINISWNELKYKAELIKNYGQIPMIECNEQRLEQVFINILVNAAQAMEVRGTIRVGTFMKGKNVCIQISDTGKGILKEHLDKIFDPFFTTKPVGKGTGLGLSVSYDIIKQHGGDVFVESQLGNGTTFTISLPMPEEEEPAV